jgi:hypothetical protein
MANEPQFFPRRCECGQYPDVCARYGHAGGYVADEPQSISAEEAVVLAVELRDKADALVALCSRISGIPFDPDDDEELALDAWFSAALDALQRTVRHA